MGNCLGAPTTHGKHVDCCKGKHPTLLQEQQLKPASSEPAFPPVNKTLEMQNSVLGKRLAEDVTEFYDIGEILGAGQFGTTRLAVHKATGEKYACKSINKARLAGMEDVANVQQELQIMHHMAGHANVVALKEAFEDHVYVHLIMELCKGGDLVDRIMRKGKYTERDAAAVIRTMLKVVAFCHEMGVVHRDLKPDNFLLDSPSDDAQLKATDFGLSTFIKPGQALTDVCGTSFYMAPEVLLREYDERADVWAIGVILYILLCGRPPFESALDEDIYRMIVDNGKPDFSHYVWDNITEPAKDCVRRMMTYNHKQRPSAREMLEHEWVCEGGVAGDNVIEPEVIHRMRSFAAMNRLKKQALLVIGQQLAPDEIHGLHELFVSMDTDGSGTISIDELRQGLASRGAALPDSELQKLLDMADVDRNNCLDYEEFVAATLHVCKLQQEHHLVAAFKHFDKDNSGFITYDELEEAFRGQAGGTAQLNMDIQQVLAEVDKDKDGRIDYAEFCQMMLPKDEVSQCAAAKFAANYAKQKAQHPQQNEQQQDAETAGTDQQAPGAVTACA